MEELVTYDPHLVPGILGGSAGTTHDAFKLLEEARASGARAALFGRKINTSEHQLTFVRFLRAIADGQIAAEEAVKAYHGELQKLGIRPVRALKEDLALTVTATSYGGGAVKPAAAGKGGPKRTESMIGGAAAAAGAGPARGDGSPDFRKMTAAQKVAHSLARIRADLSRSSGNGNSR
jgi:hypothetical protein